MNPPSQAQVNAIARHVASAAAGAVILFGLSTKIDPVAITNIINATGTLANDVILLVGLITPIVSAFYASKTASPTSQAAAVAATGAIVVTTPAIAAAVPSPNVVSSTDVKVVPNAAASVAGAPAPVAAK